MINNMNFDDARQEQIAEWGDIPKLEPIMIRCVLPTAPELVWNPEPFTVIEGGKK